MQFQKKSKKQQIIPLGFLLKFEPPTIALLYKQNEADIKKKVYNILLQDLIYLDDDVDITDLLFQEHPRYLDPSIIEPGQVLALVQKLLDYKRSAEEAFIEGEDETESHIYDDILDEDN